MDVVGPNVAQPDEVPELAAEGPGCVRADGAFRVEEVGEALGVVLEHEDVNTVTGLILSILGRPPPVGDAIEYDGVRFDVTVVRGNGVRACIASVLVPPTPGSG